MLRDIFFIIFVMGVAVYAQVNKAEIIHFMEVSEEAKPVRK